MKIKKLKINFDFKYYLCQLALLGLCSAAGIAYYSYDKQTQIIEAEANNLDTFINDEGQICCNFEPGEHRIKVSRNDAYYHQIDSIDGYTIENVSINGWRDNNQVIYVNTQSVIAVGTLNSDGTPSFNDFGKVIANDLDLGDSYSK